LAGQPRSRETSAISALGDDAPGAGHGLFRTEGVCRAAQQDLGAIEIAELRHRDGREAPAPAGRRAARPG